MKVLLIWSELGWEYKSGYINSIKLLKKTSYSSAIPVMALKEEIVQPIPFLFWLYCTYRIPELFRTQDFWKVSVGTRLWAADPSGLLQEHCWSLLSSVASSRWAPRYTAWWHCGPSPVSVIRVKPPDCIAGQQHSTTWTLLQLFPILLWCDISPSALQLILDEFSDVHMQIDFSRLHNSGTEGCWHCELCTQCSFPNSYYWIIIGVTEAKQKESFQYCIFRWQLAAVLFGRNFSS